MKGGRPLVAVVSGLVLFCAAALITVAQATFMTSPGGCVRVGTLKTVFPAAVTVGFTARGSIRHQAPRGFVWPGRCDGWWTTYTHARLSSDVSITLYDTPRQALAALSEPAYGQQRSLPNGAHVRTLITTPIINGVRSGQTGFVASAYRNVFISSTGRCSPPPGACRGTDAIADEMRIHRRIHAAILARG
jgi:hypothetical protein